MIEPARLQYPPEPLPETRPVPRRTAARLERPKEFWAIVLAGGEGVRLRSLVRRATGADRPKQYAKLLGPRTLLRQTLDRVSLGIPPERTMVVTMEGHAPYLAEEFRGVEDAPLLVAQPCDRGTAAAILYPAHRIAWDSPESTVAVFPSDHFIPGEAAFMAYVAEVGAWVDEHPDRLVLVGAPPSHPEVEYGWIEPGDLLGHVTTGPVREVRQFWEKPTLARAKACLQSGHLWNTSVVIGKVTTLIRAGEQGLPAVSKAFAEVSHVSGTGENAAVRQVYEAIPKANFSRSVLEACSDILAVSRLPRLAWTDLGNPRRLLDVLARMSLKPAWADTAASSA